MPGPLTRSWCSAYAALHIAMQRRQPFQPPERLLARQSRRLRRIVAHAWEHVPFYREAMRARSLRPTDLEAAADLVRLPIVTRDQVAAEPERFSSTAFRAGQLVELRSSGTGGAAKTIAYDRLALLTAFADEFRLRHVQARYLGRIAGLRIVTAVRGGAVGCQLLRFLHQHLWVPPGVAPRRESVPPTAGPDETTASINRVRPHLVAGYGSYLGAVFRHAHERGIAVWRPRLVAYGADAMSDSDRRLIEEVYGVPVVAGYAAVEELQLAFQCEQRDVYHLNVDRVAVRVIDETGAEVGPGGTGRIIISNLTNRATVLLNYDLGDVVRRGAGPCARGRSLPTLELLIGRSDDLVALRNGGVAHALAVLERLQAVPGVTRVQLVQEALGRFTVRAVDAPDGDRAAVVPRLRAALAGVLGDGLEIAVDLLDTIPPEPGGKARAMISRVPQKAAMSGSSGKT